MKNLGTQRMNRRGLVVLVALVSLLAAIFGIMRGAAQSQEADPEANGRKFENTIPEHVPIKVKLKSEKSFKDLNNKGWARELELVVKNTGSKPIHYLYVILLLPDSLLEDGISLGWRVSYGRSSLSEASTPLRPEETPIPPGESVTLKLREKTWKAFEMLREEGKRTDPKRIRLELQILEYGDGTGFETTQGVPLLPQPKKSSLDKPPAKESGGTCQPPAEERVKDSTVNFLKTAFSSEPASDLRVNFSLPEPSPLPAARSRDLCNCQNIPNCFYGIRTCPYQCPCDDQCQFETHVSTGSCSTPGGRCRYVELTHDECPTANNGIQTCSYDRIIAVCGEGDPTPTPPTPTPTPTPTPIPTPTPTPEPCPEPAPNTCCNREYPPAIPGEPPPPCRWNCAPNLSECSANQELNNGCYVRTPSNADCIPGYRPENRPHIANTLCCPGPPPTPTPTPAPPQHCTINWALAAWCDGYDFDSCVCPGGTNKSPVIIDLLGDGFRLTDSARGVFFDLDTDGTPERLSWTAYGSDDAFLALDRDGDGLIGKGQELFGNFTPQPSPPHGEVRNGFLALAEFDNPAQGGNSDGVIDRRDSVFTSLRLWQDLNHDGVSQATELRALPELGLRTIELKYKESKRADEYGNRFRFRAKVKDAHGAQLGRWAWDVFLLSKP